MKGPHMWAGDILIWNTLKRIYNVLSFQSEIFLIRGSAGNLQKLLKTWFFFHLSTHVSLINPQTDSQSRLFFFQANRKNSVCRLYPGVLGLHTLAAGERAEFHRCHLVPPTSICQVFPSLWRYLLIRADVRWYQDKHVRLSWGAKSKCTDNWND